MKNSWNSLNKTKKFWPEVGLLTDVYCILNLAISVFQS